MPKNPKLAIIIPCYQEEQILEYTLKNLSKIVNKLILEKKISEKSFLYPVDDGSSDRTWQIIKKSHQNNKPVIRGLKLSRNFGHQYALLAGLLSAKDKADIFITMDCDFQDDPNSIEKFIDAYLEGNDIVYGVRKSRPRDSFFKKSTADFFYRLMRLFGSDMIYNHADYRLISKKTLDHLEKYEEVNIALRGIIPLIGFKHKIIYYNRHSRQAGKSKYTLRRVLSLAFDCITSFSNAPLRLITIIGFLSLLISLILLFSSFLSAGQNFAGIKPHTLQILVILFIGSIQLLAISIIGEYLGKIYKEVKKRPRYIIEEELG